MWPEEFVRGANQEVAAEILHVGGYMRHRLHCIDVGPRPGVVRFCADRFYIVDRACQVTGASDTNQFRLVCQDGIKFFEIELECLGIEWHPSDFEAKVPGQQQPRRDICVVIHARKDDFISGFETTPNRSRDMQRQRCHVLAEYDLIGRRSIEQIGHRFVRPFD